MTEWAFSTLTRDVEEKNQHRTYLASNAPVGPETQGVNPRATDSKKKYLRASNSPLSPLADATLVIFFQLENCP